MFRLTRTDPIPTKYFLASNRSQTRIAVPVKVLISVDGSISDPQSPNFPISSRIT